jgi:amino acid transporter
MTKVVHFEGAVGFAMLVVPAFVGYSAASMAGELVPDMNPKGVLLIQIFSGLVAALVMAVVIVGISSFARDTPVPVESDEGEQ